MISFVPSVFASALGPLTAFLLRHPQLNLFNNKLASIPAGMSALACLTDVNFGSNVLVTIPDVTAWASATRLACQWNKLEALPDLSPMAATLTQLQFNDNAVTAWPELGAAAALTLLDASKNKLSFVPAALGLLTALVTLNLSGNAFLTELPEEVGELVALESLNASNCALTALPAGLGRCAALKALIVPGNRFTALPGALLDAPALVRISIASCTTIDSSDAETMRVILGLRQKCGVKGGLFKIDPSIKL